MKTLKSLLLLITCQLYMNDQSTITNKIASDSVSDIQYKTKSEYSCNYLKEKTPEKIPVLFGQGIISTNADESSFEINSKGDEMIFTREGNIYLLQYDAGGWSRPVIAPFSGENLDGECCFSPDGLAIYFASRRHCRNSNSSLNTWISMKINGKWDKPKPLIIESEGKSIHAVTISEKGNICSSGLLWASKSTNAYEKAIEFNPKIKGSHPFIDPDEDFILFCSKSQGNNGDIFISENNHGKWSTPKPLNSNINSSKQESNPFLTPDGKYLFFIRNFDVYWVKADFL